uniref:AMOTL1 n=1 Tax=Macrostomum lignano TaxID=282301 RepID=A0A1I8GZB3_9PLAT
MQEESGKQMEDLQTRMQDWSLYSTRLTEVRKSTTVNQSVQVEEAAFATVASLSGIPSRVQASRPNQHPGSDSRQGSGPPAAQTCVNEREHADQTAPKESGGAPVSHFEICAGGYSEYRQNSTQDIEDPVFRQAVYNYIQEYESEVKRYLHENIPSPIVHSQSAYAAASASEGRSQLRVGVEEKLEYSETRKLATAISSSNESEANATSSSGSGTGAAVGKTQAVTREAGCQTAQIPIASTGCDKQSVMAESKIACHLHYTVQNDLFCLEIESSDSETQTDQSGQTVETEEKLIKYESRVRQTDTDSLYVAEQVDERFEDKA